LAEVTCEYSRGLRLDYLRDGADGMPLGMPAVAPVSVPPDPDPDDGKLISDGELGGGLD